MALSKGFVQNAATTPLDARLMDSAQFQHLADGSVRTGVLYNPQSSGAILFSRTAMQVAIPSETAFVVSRSTSDGAVVLYNSGIATVALDAAPSSNSRIDTIYVRQNDSTQGDADSNPVFGVVKGTAAASPTAPAAPSGSLQLGTVLIPAGATTTQSSGVVITTTAPFAAVAGAPIRYASNAALSADSANFAEGTLAYILGGSSAGPLFYRRNGSWQRLSSAKAFGKSTANTSTTSGTGATLSIPAASFSVSDNTIMSVATNSITALIGGTYTVSAFGIWDTNATGYRLLQTIVNGSAGTYPGDSKLAVSGIATYQSFSSDVVLNANDTVTIRGTQNSGATLTFSGQFSLEYKTS